MGRGLVAVVVGLALCWAGQAEAKPEKKRQFPATGQTTSYAPGDDGDIRAGAVLSYTDNGNGTITDNNTGLVWEKKTNCTGGTHCVNDPYTWQGALDYVAALNTANFAGHNDWRLPNIKELQSIVNYENVNPSVSAVFNDCGNGSCTAAYVYWSSTSYANFPDFAWYVNFYAGDVEANYKSLNSIFVRAVRGGS